MVSRTRFKDWIFANGPAQAQAALRPGMVVTGGAGHAVRGLAASIFICDQSYGNSRPQSRQTTYVPVTEAAAVLRRNLPRTVMGKLQRLCQQPKTRSKRLITPSRLNPAV